MRKILNFKHWHLFLLIVIPAAWVSPNSLQELIVHSISIITGLIWIYSIGFYGQEKIVEIGLRKLELSLFRFNILVIPILFLLLHFLLPEDPANNGQFDLKTIIAIPISLYMVFAIFQSIVLATKTLTMIELKEQVTFNDYFFNFILIMMFFIGVWVIQPKINKLIGQ